MKVRELIVLILVACLATSCQPVSPEGGVAPATVAPVLADLPAVTDVEPVEGDAREDEAAEVETGAEETAGGLVEANDETVAYGDAPDTSMDSAADSAADEGTSRYEDPALIESGHRAYRENYCGVCHRLAVAGTNGPFGPAHDAMGRVAWERLNDPNYQGTATDAAGYIRESIVDPNIYLVPTYEVTQHRMPPYTHLSEEAIDGMVAFLLAQE